MRWFVPVPTLGGLDIIEKEVQTLGGDAVLYCGISDEQLGTPKDEHKERLVRVSLEIASLVDGFHIVLPGSSAQAMLARSMYRGMVLGARLSGRILDFSAGRVAHKLHVHRTVHEFAKAAGNRVESTASEIVTALGNAGALRDMSGNPTHAR
ncbi:MAG: hypothetical protein AAGE52_40420 [Myxococcota bacterium]